MQMDSFASKILTIQTGGESLRIRYIDIGEGLPILYLHGWGCNANVFFPLMNQLSSLGRHIALDFPGFGESERPKMTWGTKEYADFIVDFLCRLDIDSCVAVTHSFGGRVAIQLASAYPQYLSAMVLIASAGLKRTVPFMKKWKIKSIQSSARLAQRLLPATLGTKIKERLYQKIASRDWLEAGEMRDIFVRVVNEDLSDLLPSIQIPSLLIWGAEDWETPPELGQKMSLMLSLSQYIELPGFDHYSILDRGRHQTGYHISKFVKGQFSSMG